MHTSIPNKGARPIAYRCKNFLLLCSPTTNRPFSDTKNTKPLIGGRFNINGDEKRTGGPKLPVLSAFRIKNVHARTYLQPHYGNGVFGNVYLSAGKHQEINIAGTPLP